MDLKKYKTVELKELKEDYAYLYERFCAIEKAIVHFLGKKELARIEFLYEQEMTSRILQSKEHS